MTTDSALKGLVQYGLRCGLLKPEDADYTANLLLDMLHMDAPEADAEPAQATLDELLDTLVSHAVETGVCGDTLTERDLFDTRLMGALTPRPSEVTEEFRLRYELLPGWKAQREAY